MACRNFAGLGRRTERGMTLVVGLIMLLVLTLFALAATRLSTSSLRTVGNMQARGEAASAAQTAIEQVLSSTAAFTAPAAQNSDGHR